MGIRRPSADGILEAAEAVFEERGYADTSLRQLMSAAGVSTTAFYARFGSKDEVLASLLGRFLDELSSRAVRELREVRDLDEGFDRGIDVLVDVVSRHRKVVAVALAEGGASATVRETLRRTYGTLAELLASRIRKLAESGKLDVDDPATVAWALVGALQIQVARWAVFGELGEDALRDALRASARTFLRALRS